MTRRTSLTDQLYRAARLSADMRAAARGPVPYAKRQVRKTVYRKQGTWTRAFLKSLGL